MLKLLKWFGITFAAGFVLIIVLVVVFASGGDNGRTESPGSVVTASAKGTAITAIKGNAEVVDAAITQDGNSLSLVLIVRSATNAPRARELGDNFVRQVKTFSDDDSPGKEIGTGRYDYLIGVYYPNEKQVVSGAKNRVAARISW